MVNLILEASVWEHSNPPYSLSTTNNGGLDIMCCMTRYNKKEYKHHL